MKMLLNNKMTRYFAVGLVAVFTATFSGVTPAQALVWPSFPSNLFATTFPGYTADGGFSNGLPSWAKVWDDNGDLVYTFDFYNSGEHKGYVEDVYMHESGLLIEVTYYEGTKHDISFLTIDDPYGNPVSNYQFNEEGELFLMEIYNYVYGPNYPTDPFDVALSGFRVFMLEDPVSYTYIPDNSGLEYWLSYEYQGDDLVITAMNSETFEEEEFTVEINPDGSVANAGDLPEFVLEFYDLLINGGPIPEILIEMIEFMNTKLPRLAYADVAQAEKYTIIEPTEGLVEASNAEKK